MRKKAPPLGIGAERPPGREPANRDGRMGSSGRPTDSTPRKRLPCKTPLQKRRHWGLYG
jgi:hypothetical protein